MLVFSGQGAYLGLWVPAWPLGEQVVFEVGAGQDIVTGYRFAVGRKLGGL